MKADEAARRAGDLTTHIRAKAREADVPLDTYDPDWVLGTIMAWLGPRGLALTGHGIRRIRSET